MKFSFFSSDTSCNPLSKNTDMPAAKVKVLFLSPPTSEDRDSEEDPWSAGSTYVVFPTCEVDNTRLHERCPLLAYDEEVDLRLFQRDRLVLDCLDRDLLNIMSSKEKGVFRYLPLTERVVRSLLKTVYFLCDGKKLPAAFRASLEADLMKLDEREVFALRALSHYICLDSLTFMCEICFDLLKVNLKDCRKKKSPALWALLNEGDLPLINAWLIVRNYSSSSPSSSSTTNMESLLRSCGFLFKSSHSSKLNNLTRGKDIKDFFLKKLDIVKQAQSSFQHRHDVAQRGKQLVRQRQRLQLLERSHDADSKAEIPARYKPPSGK